LGRLSIGARDYFVNHLYRFDGSNDSVDINALAPHVAINVFIFTPINPSPPSLPPVLRRMSSIGVVNFCIAVLHLLQHTRHGLLQKGTLLYFFRKRVG